MTPPMTKGLWGCMFSVRHVLSMRLCKNWMFISFFKKKPLYLASSPAGFIYYTVLHTSAQESSSSQLVNFLVEHFQLLNDDLGLCHAILYFVYYIDGTIKKNPSIQSCILIFVTLTISVLSSNILGVFFETYTERNVWMGITKFSSFCFCKQNSNNNNNNNKTR